MYKLVMRLNKTQYTVLFDECKEALKIIAGRYSYNKEYTIRKQDGKA